jgi:hypothetical protein
MNKSQARRLSALSVARLPCLGCCLEDLQSAQWRMDELSLETIARRRTMSDRMRDAQGMDPATCLTRN